MNAVLCTCTSTFARSSRVLCRGYRGKGAETFLYTIEYVYCVDILLAVCSTVFTIHLQTVLSYENDMDRVCIPRPNRHIQEQNI